jgi:HSP20 family protein
MLGIDPFPIQMGHRVDEQTQVLTVLVGNVPESAVADTGRSTRPISWPPLDLFESRHAFLVRVDVPGVKAGDLNVALAGGLLVVSGARYLAAGPDGERFHRLERPGGSFRRSIALPTAATLEMVHASVEDGVLTVVVPKLASRSQARVAVHPVRTAVTLSREGR